VTVTLEGKAMNLIHLGTALAAVAMLAACSTTGGVSDAKAGSNADPPADAPTAESTPAPTADPLPLFGQTYTWEDGIAVTVSKPHAYQPTEYAIGTGKTNVRFTVTIVNGSKRGYHPEETMLSLQSGNREATEIYDDRIIGIMGTVLLPGREGKYDVAYGMRAATDLVMEVAPTFDHEPATFVSTTAMSAG
jgi:hypothetical protein